MTQYQHAKNADAFLLSSQANQTPAVDSQQYGSSLVDHVDQNQLNEARGDFGLSLPNQVNAMPRNQMDKMQQYMGGGSPAFQPEMDSMQQ